MTHKRILLALWVAFCVVLVGMGALGSSYHNLPVGDVTNVYEPWSRWALEGYVMGVHAPWVYPHLALIPMVLARVLFFFLPTYLLQWAAFVALINVLGFATLLGRKPTPSRMLAAMFWTLAIIATGFVYVFRIEGVTVPLVVIAMLWLRRHPIIAGALLAIGAWIKIWPAAIALAAVTTLRSRWRVLAGAVSVTIGVAALVIGFGGGQYLLGFLGEQSGRGMQVEAPLGLPFVWATLLQIPGSAIYYSNEIITFQVMGPGSDVLATASTALMAFGVAAVCWMGFVRVRAGVSPVKLMPPLALALVLVLIVFNKVGSPQFHAWLIAPLVAWIVLDRLTAKRFAIAGLVAMLLTQLVYPVLYNYLLAANIWGVLAITARDGVLIWLLVATVTHLAHLGVRTENPEHERVERDTMAQDELAA